MAPNLIEKETLVLQYTHDTVICLDHSLESALNLKLMLYLFYIMPGLEVSYVKSEIFLVGGDNVVAKQYTFSFGCKF